MSNWRWHDHFFIVFFVLSLSIRKVYHKFILFCDFQLHLIVHYKWYIFCSSPDEHNVFAFIISFNFILQTWPPHKTSTFIIHIVADQSVDKKMRRYISAALPVIEYIDKLYLSRNINLDWWLHICGRQKNKCRGFLFRKQGQIVLKDIHGSPLKHLSLNNSHFLCFFSLFLYSNYTISVLLYWQAFYRSGGLTSSIYLEEYEIWWSVNKGVVTGQW